MKKLMIFDGNSILNRAFYGIKMLSNSKGVFTNGIYGFLNIYFKFLEEEKPDFVAVAFDLRAKTFRHKMFDGYKAQRKGMPDELAQQMPYLKDILKAMNVAILECEGFEADDIIGTVSKKCEDEDILCRIVTGDKDDLQLASKNTIVKLIVTRMGRTETTDFDENAVFEKYGVTPKEFISVKALMGDTSDNIPGVSGIGEKSAFELIKEFKSLDNLYANTDSLKGAKKTKIEDGKEMAYLSYTLSEIVRNVPMETEISDMTLNDYNQGDLFEILDELELKSIIERTGIQKQKETVTFEAVEAKESDFEVSEFVYLMDFDEELKEIVFFKDGKIYYKSFESPFEVMAYTTVLKNIFENEGITKISHGIKKDIVFLKNNFDIDYNGEFFDTEIASYILAPTKNEYLLSDLCEEYLKITVADKQSAAGILPNLKKVLCEKIEENQQHELLYDVEFPLVKVLASMEIEGFRVDRDKLHEFSGFLAQRISVLETGIYDMAGETFNINSPKQLGVILFEKLNLPAVKKTKTGYSTNAEVLEKLVGKHDIIEYIMEYRTLSKLKSTYADGLYDVINPQTGKINSSFNQTITATGRISSTEPNLQNIPVRTEIGREIRKMFIASDDEHILVDADYSQIELRVLASMSQDENMMEAFLSGVDIHKMTASKAFNMPLDMVTPLLRSRAKAVNFGIVYGISEFSLAQDIKVTRKEAAKYIEDYFATYPKVKEYLDGAVSFAKENGYVKTPLNRRRYIPEIKASNFNLRSFGERVAMNAPIQGYAADIIKIAMVKVFNRLQKENLKSKLILQVHDELIIDALKSEEEQVRKILKEEMENAVKLNVPLAVDMASGNSWFETK